MKNENALEKSLYKEWTEAQKRADHYRELANSNPDAKTAEFYMQLSQVERTCAIDVLEIIYHFEKARAT